MFAYSVKERGWSVKRNWKEERKYDIFGEVRISYEFMGDINESDFTVFLRDYLGKQEKDHYTLREYPKTFHKQCLETERSRKNEKKNLPQAETK